MEDTLRGKLKLNVLYIIVSLNPCFNGRYSQSLELLHSMSGLTWS